jgi:hypothetical protein
MPFDGHTNVRMQILLDARSLLARRNGWCQHALHINKKGRASFCIIGAVKMAAQHHSVNLALNPDVHAVVQSLLLVLGEPKSVSPQRIADFNDTKNRRKHEVLSLMDRAMEYLV